MKRSRKKEKPLSLAAEGATGDVVSDDTTECKDEQVSYLQDLTEADPTEPENPKDVQGSYWCFVWYPEKHSIEWLIEQLQMSGVKFAISPLHCDDVNPDGTPKKPHYHVIVLWRNKTTYNAVKTFTHKTLGGTVPKVLLSPVGYYRYFTHEDNPEKAQYSQDDIVTGNGFDISEFKKKTAAQRLQLRKDVMSMIRDNCIVSYSQAVDACEAISDDFLEEITNSTIFYQGYCKSLRYDLNEVK